MKLGDMIDILLDLVERHGDRKIAEMLVRNWTFYDSDDGESILSSDFGDVCLWAEVVVWKEDDQ